MDRVSEILQNPNRMLYRIALPLVVGELIRGLYTLVDAFFISFLGTQAIAALTYCTPFVLFLLALAAGVGIGTTSAVSRYLGHKRINRAALFSNQVLMVSSVLAVGVSVLGLLTLKPLLILFGASGEVLSLSVEYQSVLYIGYGFFLVSIAFMGILCGQGNTRPAVVVQVIGIGLNIVLDPLFIFVFKWGMAGAALATVVASLTSCLIYIGMFWFFKISLFPIQFRLRFYTRFAVDLLRVGFPSALSLIILGVGIAGMTAIASGYGDQVVAGFGIGFKLESILFLTLIGFSNGCIAVAGIISSSQDAAKLRSFIRYALTQSVLISVVFGFILMLFAKPFYLLFTRDPEVIHVGVVFFRILFFEYPFAAIVITVGRIMQGFGDGWSELVLSTIRIFLSVFFAFVVSLVIPGTYFIWYPFVFAAILAAGMAMWVIRKELRKRHHALGEPLPEFL